MIKCKNVFWVENISDLFCDFRLVPLKNMNLESQMNALTRLVFFIFVLLLLFLDIKNSLIFFVIGIIMIIMFYYIKRKSYKEMYEELKENINNEKKSKKNKKASTNHDNKYQNKYDAIYNNYYDTYNTNDVCYDNVPDINSDEYDDEYDNNYIPEYLPNYENDPEYTDEYNPNYENIENYETEYNTKYTRGKEAGNINVPFKLPMQDVWVGDSTPINFNHNNDVYTPIIDKYSNYYRQPVGKEYPTPYKTYPKNNKFDKGKKYSKQVNKIEQKERFSNKVVGNANPKTLIPPVVVPPIADLSYWKNNNLTTHSHINSQPEYEVYQSGYQVTTDCGTNDDNLMMINNNTPKLFRNNQKYDVYRYKGNNYSKNKYDLNEYTDTKENFLAQKELDKLEKRKKEMKKEAENKKKNNNINDDEEEDMIFPYEIKPNYSGLVNTKCGYDPSQLLYSNLPSNYPSGKCQKNKAFKEYNEEIFREIIQPGVYTNIQVDEPINSNIGISFTQQFEPLTSNIDEDGNLNYTLNDPRIFNGEEIEPYEETVNETNVYDPRFSGYGTSYRAYTDENVGQTRFYYDDINSVRMPNYIVRSKIDFMKEADTYGPMNDANGNVNNNHIRNLANNEFHRAALEFRTGLQERLMRKVNASKWQQKVAPIHKNF